MQSNRHLDSPDPLSGLRVAVTGGTSGLGLAFVKELVARGAQVAFVARRRELVELVGREHPGTHGIVGDVAQKNDIYPMAMQIVGELGGLDVLINNASDLGPTPLVMTPVTNGGNRGQDAIGSAASATIGPDGTIYVGANLIGPFRLTKALLGALAASAREGRGAVVLNVSSDAAINAYPQWGAYGASKAALHHLSRIWDAELATEGVRFLSLDPGDMDTPLHALAVPDADPSTLRRPEDAARELADAIAGALPNREPHISPQIVAEHVGETR